MHAQSDVTTIVAAISPYIGQTMAQTSIHTYCRKLGIDGEHPHKSQLDQLLKHLSLGLNIFIGRDKTESIMRELRVSLGVSS